MPRDTPLRALPDWDGVVVPGDQVSLFVLPDGDVRGGVDEHWVALEKVRGGNRVVIKSLMKWCKDTHRTAQVTIYVPGDTVGGSIGVNFNRRLTDAQINGIRGCYRATMDAADQDDDVKFMWDVYGVGSGSDIKTMVAASRALPR